LRSGIPHFNTVENGEEVIISELELETVSLNMLKCVHVDDKMQPFLVTEDLILKS